MAVLSWGKPKLEIIDVSDGQVPQQEASWIELDVPVEGSSNLSTEKGEKKEAKEEGGGVVDSKTNKNTYVFEFELYAKKGGSKPIEDDDGFIPNHYAIRLTPEDSTVKGWVMNKASVSVETTWTSEDGEKWKYTFSALKPQTGKALEDYTSA